MQITAKTDKWGVGVEVSLRAETVQETEELLALAVYWNGKPPRLAKGTMNVLLQLIKGPKMCVEIAEILGTSRNCVNNTLVELMSRGAVVRERSEVLSGRPYLYRIKDNVS